MITQAPTGRLSSLLTARPGRRSSRHGPRSALRETEQGGRNRWALGIHAKWCRCTSVSLQDPHLSHRAPSGTQAPTRGRDLAILAENTDEPGEAAPQSACWTDGHPGAPGGLLLSFPRWYSREEMNMSGVLVSPENAPACACAQTLSLRAARGRCREPRRVVSPLLNHRARTSRRPIGKADVHHHCVGSCLPPTGGILRVREESFLSHAWFANASAV